MIHIVPKSIKLLTLKFDKEKFWKQLINKMKMKKISLLLVVLLVAIVSFGQETTPELKQNVVKMIWAFLQDNWWWIATALLAISEGLASSKLKSNSIYQLVTNWLKKKAVKP